MNIQHDPVRTATHLRELSRGYICDTWNEGYYQPVVARDNAYYWESWDSIQAVDVVTQYDLTGLPKVARDYIDRELKNHGIKNLHGKKLFEFFTYPANSQKPTEHLYPRTPRIKLEL